MDIKKIIEEFDKFIGIPEEGVKEGQEIAEGLEEKPADMEKAEYKEIDVKEPEVETIAKNLLKEYDECFEKAEYKDMKIVKPEVDGNKKLLKDLEEDIPAETALKQTLEKLYHYLEIEREMHQRGEWGKDEYKDAAHKRTIYDLFDELDRNGIDFRLQNSLIASAQSDNHDFKTWYEQSIAKTESEMNEKYINFEGSDFKGMVNPETGEIIYSHVSPKHSRTLNANLKADINDEETYENKELLKVAKQALNTTKAESLLSQFKEVFAGNLDIDIPGKVWRAITTTGENDIAVEEGLKDPYIAEQFAKLTDEQIDTEYLELAADITDEEFAKLTRHEKEAFILWSLAWNISDGAYNEDYKEIDRWASEEDVSEEDYLETYEYIYSLLTNGNLEQYREKLKELKADYLLADFKSWCREMAVNPCIDQILNPFPDEELDEALTQKTADGIVRKAFKGEPKSFKFRGLEVNNAYNNGLNKISVKNDDLSINTSFEYDEQTKRFKGDDIWKKALQNNNMKLNEEDIFKYDSQIASIENRIMRLNRQIEDLPSGELTDEQGKLFDERRRLEAALKPLKAKAAKLQNESMNEVSDEVADNVALTRKIKAQFAQDELEGIERKYDDAYDRLEQENVTGQALEDNVEELDAQWQEETDDLRKTIKKAEKNQELMAKRQARKSIKNEALELPSKDTKFNYMMLSRMQMDCDYFINNPCEKHLWAGSVDRQIELMNKLYDALPEKPEWLTKEQLDNYETRMKEVMAKRAARNESWDVSNFMVRDENFDNEFKSNMTLTDIENWLEAKYDELDFIRLEKPEQEELFADEIETIYARYIGKLGEQQFEGVVYKMVVNGGEPVNESVMNEISQELADEVNTKRQVNALKAELKAQKDPSEENKEAAEQATEKAQKNIELTKRWKKAKGIKESKVVARFEENNNTHEIIRTSKGKYNIRYNVVEGKARSTRAGVQSLPVAIDALKKRFPEATEVKLNEGMQVPMSEVSAMLGSKVEQERLKRLQKAQDELDVKKAALLNDEENEEIEKEYLDAQLKTDKLADKYLKTAVRNIKRQQESFVTGDKVNHEVFGEGVIVKELSFKNQKLYEVEYNNNKRVNLGKDLKKI